MGKIIIIYGLPAAGKTTQALLIQEKYGLYHFGMGDKLRAEIESGSELGQQIKETVDNGLLVSDEQIIKILHNIQGQAQKTGIVFDGFPRLEPQARLLDEMLTQVNLEVDLFILLKIRPEVAEQRIGNRAESGGRSDDKDKNVVNNRLEVFRQESESLMAHYQKMDKFLEIDGEKTITEVFAEIDKHLSL